MVAEDPGGVWVVAGECCDHHRTVKSRPHRLPGRESRRLSHRLPHPFTHPLAHWPFPVGNTSGMRITLPSGTPAEIHTVDNPKMGLVVICDIWGLRPLFDDMVARLAQEWQMNVIAVEPFPGRDLPAGDMGPRAAAIPELRDDDNLRDLEEAADELRTPVVGLMGFCLGGMYCFKAARSDRFARIIPFYGMITIPEAWRSHSQGEPLAYMIQGNADCVLAILGGEDPYTPLADIDQLRATGATCVIYPHAEHGFAHDASRPNHRADDAADAFRRTKEWLLDALA